MLLEGLHIPLTTPFHPDGRFHPHKLAANVIRYSKSPAQGLIALAPSAGEPTLLSDDEIREALRTVAEASAPEKVLTAYLPHDSVRSTLALAEVAAENHYDCVLLAAPTFARITSASETPRTVAETLNYLRAVADRSPLPVVLLSSAANPLSATILAAVSTHPNIIGLLDATTELGWDSSAVRQTTSALRREVTVTTTFGPVTARMLREASAAEQPAFVTVAALARNPAAASTAVAQPPTIPAVRTRTKTIGFQVISMGASHLLDSLTRGAAGIALPFAACAPQSCYEVYAAWKDGEEPLALEKQERIRAAAEYAYALGPAALKFGCDLNGYFGGLPRLPHLPLTAEQRIRLQQHMQFLRT